MSYFINNPIKEEAVSWSTHIMYANLCNCLTKGFVSLTFMHAWETYSQQTSIQGMTESMYSPVANQTRFLSFMNLWFPEMRKEKD